MIAKASVGRSFGGVVRYLFEGHYDDLQANKQAEILAANGVRLGSMEQMISDFNRHRALNTDLGVAVWHTALAFHADDRPKLTDKKLIELAEDYMRELRLDPDNIQWLLVKHNDTAHPHIHLVMSRVDFNGRTVDKSFCKDRSRETAKRIAKQQGLIVAVDRQRSNVVNGRIMSVEWMETKCQIQTAVVAELPHVSSLVELAQKLQLQQIQIHFQRRKQKKGKGAITGITFEANGHFIRGRNIGKEFSAGPLQKQLQQTLRSLKPYEEAQLLYTMANKTTASEAHPAVKSDYEPILSKVTGKAKNDNTMKKTTKNVESSRIRLP